MICSGLFGGAYVTLLILSTEENCGSWGKSPDLSPTKFLHAGLGLQPVPATGFLGHVLGLAEFRVGHRTAVNVPGWAVPL